MTKIVCFFCDEENDDCECNSLTKDGVVSPLEVSSVKIENDWLKEEIDELRRVNTILVAAIKEIRGPRSRPCVYGDQGCSTIRKKSKTMWCALCVITEAFELIGHGLEKEESN